MLKTGAQRILELDALRGIAALMVVLFHFTMDKPEARYGFKFGVTGVDLFFMISGFVILLTIEHTKTWRDFVINRLSRLYPTYWVCVSITTIFLILINGTWPKVTLQYLANLTMFQTLMGQPDIDGPYWTMLVEMLFYLYMLTLFALGKIRQAEVISLIFTGVIFGYALLFHFIPPNKLFYQVNYHLVLVNHFPLFCAGVLFYKMKVDRITTMRWLYLFVCYLCQLLLFNYGGRSHYYLTTAQDAIILLIYFTVFYCFVEGYLKFLINPLTLFLGNISFALYLIHQAIGVNTFIYLNQYVSSFVAYMVALILVITIAFILNRTIEVPAMKFIRRRYRSDHKEVPSDIRLTS